MQFRNLIITILALGCMACRADVEQLPSPDEEPLYREVAIRASQAATTRTLLGEGDGTVGSAQEIRWEVGDRLALWAQAEGASTFAFERVGFQLTTFNEVYSSADFLATIPSMAAGTYTYYGVYPEPATGAGTTVSYTLPTTQSGSYDPSLDVMSARATGNALAPYVKGETMVPWSQPELQFEHLTHLVRIRIPEGKNYLGLRIKRLEITFPQEVVGTLSFDVTDPENTAVWSNLSNKVVIELDENHLIDAGDGYLWLHLMPTELNGTISFVAYNEAGVQAAEITTSIQKSLQAQHVTPIALTIPESPFAPLTYVNLREVASNLGEDWQTMTFSGYTFVDTATNSTTNSLQLAPLSSKNYYVVICAEPSSMGGVTLPLRYESEHCLFDDPIQLPQAVADNTVIRVDKTVPYLLEEDFSRISSSFEDGSNYSGSDATERDAISLASYGLNDWYGARVGGAAGQNIRIASRIETGMFITNKNTGRVDTPVLSKLKPNANASIKVDYDYAGDRYEAVGSGGFPVYSAGTTTSVVTAGDDEIPSVFVGSVELAIDGPNANGTYYGVTPHHNTFTATGCANTTRVSWYITNNRSGSFAGNGMYWMYIDNVKVQIAQ
ncbi:MAG: fimbrillin family protein [Alistipes sp.]|nr:fimbrillin family protein [Alistipes sp.]